MTRAQQTVSLFLIVSAVYLACVYGLVPFIPRKVQNEILPVLPLWAIVSFGAYLLGKLGWGVLVFNDVPDAHASLMKEIDEARSDLRNRGVEVD